ncbi:hypothetical protein QVD17_30078 [Tagetes erecta]|uniref:Homeobox domain-containing protein n=1 Tax=Tagetes erecta TaxID=13708 RepID=A0AAD8NLX4_TARER|nr:hypothetical protein QVD17_30078 [Tagetes erecta]
MGRPPCNGAPPFRFNPAEIMEMEAILQAHRTAVPDHQVLVSLAEKFSKSEERIGKVEVQMKQVWNWFQNRRYAIRAKASKVHGNLNVTQMAREGSAKVKSKPQVTQPHAASSVNATSLPQVPQRLTVPSVQAAGRMMDNSLEYEAKSARDGAWYDISTFLSHRSLETGDLEVLVRLVGFGAEEDEWVNVLKHVRQRSLPCESSECVAVLPADLILCFQEGEEQALYFDARVLDSQRRRHDVRGCRCRFLVRYDHDQSEEIVPLRKICRRPETDYRLQQLHALNKNAVNNNHIHTVSTLRVYPPAEVQPKQQKPDPVAPPEAPLKRQRLDSVLSPEGSESQFKVEPVVMTDVPPASSAQPLVDPQNVEPVVLVSSGQGSGECQNAMPVTPIGLDETRAELQQLQPGMPDRSTEVSADSLKVETDVPAQPLRSVRENETEESMLIVSSNELHVVEEQLENKTDEPVVTVSTNVPNVVEAVESKFEEPVVPVSVKDVNVVQETNGPVVPVSVKDVNVVPETKTEEPVVPVSSNEPCVVRATKTEEAVVPAFSSDSNVVKEAIEIQIMEHVVHASTNDPNAVRDDKTEEPVVPTNDPSVDQG